jgi:hypothetical protein
VTGDCDMEKTEQTEVGDDDGRLRITLGSSCGSSCPKI